MDASSVEIPGSASSSQSATQCPTYGPIFLSGGPSFENGLSSDWHPRKGNMIIWVGIGWFIAGTQPGSKLPMSAVKTALGIQYFLENALIGISNREEKLNRVKEISRKSFSEPWQVAKFADREEPVDIESDVDGESEVEGKVDETEPNPSNLTVLDPTTFEGQKLDAVSHVKRFPTGLSMQPLEKYFRIADCVKIIRHEGIDCEVVNLRNRYRLKVLWEMFMAVKPRE
ncbi:hypothetical protein G7Y89_g6671 [Cudoniella acicularis]|uniref:Uncharacterized protein n=1 Tax=Cudoniella acicularis TaxID=354080 RepID=A0A8H4RLH6_9HELO|nr:hypothetical protein G7Y89_g6671 [Cudoniella acicularis]